MKDCRGTQPSSLVDGVDAAISAWTADLGGKTLGKEEDRELAAWKEFDAFCPVAHPSITRTIVDTCWVLTWELIGGGEASAKARFAVKVFQDPDLQRGLVETAGRVSLRSSHFQ